MSHPSLSLAENAPVPPVAPRRPVVFNDHGVERVDPYFWLREKGDPEVETYLKAENAYTEAVTSAWKPLEDQLYEELVGRIEENDVSAPYPYGDYVYYDRAEKGKSYRIYCRKRRDDPKAPEQVLLDGNQLAEGHEFFDLGSLEISPDGTRMAYTVDIEGNEEYTLHFVDLATGKPIDKPIAPVSAGGEWSACGGFYFYEVEDESKRVDRVLRHRIGTSPKRDVVVFHETDPRFYAGVYRSQDERFVFFYALSKQTSEVHWIRADTPESTPQLVFPRRTDTRYFLEHHEGEFLVRTNDEAENFKLLAVPVDDPDLKRARIVLPHREKVRFDAVLPLRDFLVFFERTKGLDQIRVLDLKRHEEHLVRMPDDVYMLSEAENAEYATSVLNFTYASPIRPTRTLAYDLGSRAQTILKESRVPSGHDPDAFRAYRIEATAEDGTRIPVTVFHSRGIALDGSNPTLLMGYGAYGATFDPHFSRAKLALLNRGFVCAIAHVRGGGLLGESWYQEGKLLKKANTFSDFIACAEKLIEEGYTSPEYLAIEGGSAGGLLVGAVLNQRPDLFRAAVAQVPFVDVVNTMLDESLPLTTFEWEEWGNPAEPEYFEYIRDYSPYDNITAQAYPAMLVTGGLNDARVSYWEPAKWVARLRELKTDDNLLLLRINMDAGHGGASGRYEAWREIAFEQAFILRQLGVE